MKGTKEIINGLPENIRKKVEEYRLLYTMADDIGKKAEARNGMAGYALGLRDAGVLTDRERQHVFVYMTVAARR